MIRPIAIYLPQFHPTPQNDAWWGKGFTEWTNVTKAEPFFKDHYQPRLPSDLGFYDLRSHDTRAEQARLAKAYGIHGFCYYHYWFNSERILERPFNEVVKSGEPDFPFMLCWANETWSRRWLGEEKEVLLKQAYSEEDDRNHATWLCENAFNDKRYITVHGRPAFIIYRPHDLPDAKKTIAIFKEVARSKGLPEPYMIASNSHSQELEGFDHVLNFEPQLGMLTEAFYDKPTLRKLKNNLKQGVLSPSLKVYDYRAVKELMAGRKFEYPYFPCVFVGWDNTARRGRKGVIIVNQNKEDFKASLQRAKQMAEQKPEEEQLVFINAWNEWAEGNHLEPCRKYGHAFLEAVKETFHAN
jgi:lipopolysaccharide biosynthesis protein